MEKYVHRRSDRHLPPASLIVFAALLCGFALVNLFWPKRENSELENRKLAQMPVFSVKTLLNGKGSHASVDMQAFCGGKVRNVSVMDKGMLCGADVK